MKRLAECIDGEVVLIRGEQVIVYRTKQAVTHGFVVTVVKATGREKVYSGCTRCRAAEVE